MKKIQKSFRKAFNIYALIAGLTIMSITGAVVVPSVQNYYIKERVKDIVSKERLLKDIYTNYFTKDTTVIGHKTLIDRAIEMEILDSTASHNSYQFLNNGFGGQITIVIDRTVSPVTFVSQSGLKGTSHIFAQKAYSGLTYSIISNSNESEVGNTYSMLDLTKKELIQEIKSKAGADIINNNSITNNPNHLTEADARTLNNANKAGKEWWKYDAKTDTFAVNTWNGSSWEVTDTRSSGAKSSDGNYYVNNIDEVNASTVASGTKVVVENGGSSLEYIAINGRWQIKAASEAEFVSVPSIVTRFKDMLDRESTKNYFYAQNDSNTTVMGLWGQNIDFVRVYEGNSSNYWKSLPTDIPHYKSDELTLSAKNIFLATELKDLKNLDENIVNNGDVAFLRENNNEGYGYKGIQEIRNNRGKLYPEAVFHSGNWIYFAPRAGDALRVGFTAEKPKYYAQDVDKIVSFTDYDANDGMRRFKADNNSLFLTQGSRIHFDTVVEANEDAIYLSAMLGDVGEYPIYSTQGVISKYLYTDTSTMFEWGYSKTDVDEVTNRLSDIAEGKEIVVNEESRVGNQGEDKFILQLSGYSGKFVVVYTDNGNIMARVYDGFGEPTTDEIRVNTTGLNNTKPHGAVLKNGNIVITWQSGSSVKARVFLTSLEPKTTTEINVGYGSVPQVANSANSTFVVVWQGASGANCSIPFSSYDYDSLLKNGTCVTNTASQLNPKIISASPDANSFMVAWENGTTSVDANFYTIDSVQHISTTASLTNIGTKSSVSNITLARKYGGSNFGIAFQTGTNIYKAKINSGGTSESLTVTGSQPSIAFDKDSKIVLVYKDGKHIKATYFSSNRDTYDIISKNSHTNQHPIITPIMMSDNNAMFVVAWEVKNGSDVDIAMRFRYYGSAGSASKYLEDEELIVNNINSAGNQYAPLPVSLRIINGGHDEERGCSFRYVSVAWTGKNIDGDGLGVALRTYNLSNIKWKEEH